MTDEQNFAVVYNYSGHSESVETYDTLEDAKKGFDEVLKNWGEVEPHDQSLEVIDFEEGETHYEHIFNEGNWECDD